MESKGYTSEGYTSEQVVIVRESFDRLRLIGPLFGPGYVNIFERVVGPEDHPVYDNAMRMLRERDLRWRQARTVKLRHAR